MISTFPFPLCNTSVTVCCLVLFQHCRLPFLCRQGLPLLLRLQATSRHQCTGYHDGGTPSSYSYRGRRNRPSFQLHVVEHAINCIKSIVTISLGRIVNNASTRGFTSFQLGGALNKQSDGFFIVIQYSSISKNSLGNFNIYDYDGM